MNLDTIACADALDYLAALPDKSVDMVFTDPPYGNNNGVDDLAAARARDKVRGGRQRGDIPAIANDDRQSWEMLMPRVFAEFARVLKPEASCCCCCGGGGPSPVFASISQWMDSYMTFFHAVVWDKSGRGDGLGWRYRRNYEFVMVAHPKNGKLAWNDTRPPMANVLRDAPVPNVYHPTQKPLSQSRYEESSLLNNAICSVVDSCAASWNSGNVYGSARRFCAMATYSGLRSQPM